MSKLGARRVEAYPRPVLSRRSQPSSPRSQVGEFRPVAKPLPARHPAPTRRRHAPRPSPRRLGFSGVGGRLRVGTSWHSLATFGRGSTPPRAGLTRAPKLFGAPARCQERLAWTMVGSWWVDELFRSGITGWTQGLPPRADPHSDLDPARPRPRQSRRTVAAPEIRRRTPAQVTRAMPLLTTLVSRIPGKSLPHRELRLDAPSGQTLKSCGTADRRTT
jgi:hypothetical protein